LSDALNARAFEWVRPDLHIGGRSSAAASRFGALSFFMIVAQCSTMGSGSDHEEHGLDYCTPTRRERAA
jgi:hypothetical protein